MTTQTIKLKNGIINLPQELKKSREGADVFVSADERYITISRLQRPGRTLKELKPALRELGNMITPEEIDEAVREVRAEQK